MFVYIGWRRIYTMHKKFIWIIVGIAIIIAFIAFGGIGIEKLINPADSEASTLRRQVDGLKAQINRLKSQNEKYIIEIRDLTAQVSAGAGAQPGGLAAEEKRKALTVREAELNRREQQLVQQEEEFLTNRVKLEDERRRFFNDREIRVEEIGQAREIKENQERMLDRLAQAEERAESAQEIANTWLMIIYAISGAFLVGIFLFVAFLYRTATNDRRVAMTMRTVDSVSLNARDRNLLMASLGGRITEQLPDDSDKR